MEATTSPIATRLTALLSNDTTKARFVVPRSTLGGTSSPLTAV